MSNVGNMGGMRPKMGDSMIHLPVTFDYSGGRKDSNKSRMVWSIVLIVISIIMGVGLMTKGEGDLFMNVVMGIGVIVGMILIIRFPIMKEGKIRSDMINLVDEDYKFDYNKLWGIYEVEYLYPHYCRFRNGQSGLFVRLNKDVILGKYSESEYEHYEAIADALNLAGEGQVRICHVDYMDNVGTDERLEESFASLADVKNTDVKELLTDVYSYLQHQMMLRVTTFDVYLFMWIGSDINAWNTIQRILACFLDANYRSYHILDATDLRELDKTLYNLHDFSVVDATSNAFAVTDYKGVVPISKVNMFGEETVYNKTLAQKRKEQQQQMKEQEIKKQELNRKKQNKKSKKNKNKEDEIDLFN